MNLLAKTWPSVVWLIFHTATNNTQGQMMNYVNNGREFINFAQADSADSTGLWCRELWEYITSAFSSNSYSPLLPFHHSVLFAVLL